MTNQSASDPYWGMGEFHDLFMDGAWEQVRPVLVEAFGGLERDAVVVDLGAGSGIGTRLLAQSTAARVIAVEPSLMMRAVLTARVADDPTLAERVTVLADAAPQVLERIGRPLAGFVCAHVLGHLSTADRVSTWRGLARQLDVDARGVVVVDDGSEHQAGDPAVVERRIGEHRYMARHLPAGVGSYESEYTVLDGDRVVRHERFTGSWRSITLRQLDDELVEHGLSVEARGAGVGLVSRPRPEESTDDPPPA